MDTMEILEIQPFIKYVVLRIDLLFETKIIDEANFAVNDVFSVEMFKRKYIYMDNYVIVKIEM